MDRVTMNEYLLTNSGKAIQNIIKGLKNIPQAFINHLDEQPGLLSHQRVADFLGLRKKTVQDHVKKGFLKEENGLVVKQSLIDWINELCKRP